MNMDLLYEKLDNIKSAGYLRALPDFIEQGLSKNIVLREYQVDAFRYFIEYYENENLRKNKQIHTLFHMATGSGKTVIMAGLILYLYTKGYRKFLFFVNQTNVLEKTIDNFINNLSSKYLFNQEINYLGNRIQIKKVENFSNDLNDDIEIVFTTTQKLHLDLWQSKENSLTYEDFRDHKVVFISDESHHINTLTKKPTKDEEEAQRSWEYSVMDKAFMQNKDNIMLEFTATCDLKDNNVKTKYLDKIIFNYPLVSFRESGYTKDFQNFATDTDLWTRSLIALVMSEYRKFLFSDLKLNIKPVIMLKSQKIVESEMFYEEFYKKLDTLSVEELKNLKNVGIGILSNALDYFEVKENSLELLKQSIKNSFSKEHSIIIHGSSDNNKENQLLVNSLEDKNNPIRLIFAVDMLNEGWDVLNLFDIVRLYDTRQGSGKPGKIGSYTIKEAQLIGRGARYCPFVVENMEIEQKFKRKYDNDINNQNRILETMFFHSRNDSKYISELRQALIATGLQPVETIELEYKLKESFKESDFYKNSIVFYNKRIIKSRNEVKEIEGSLKTKNYQYKVLSQKGNVFSLFDEDDKIRNTEEKTKTIKFNDIPMNILLGGIDCYEELRFDLLKYKYPNLTSKKEFLTSENYLGNSTLEIKYYAENLTGRDIFNALKYALNQVATHISSIKPSYEGTKQFSAKYLKEVLKDKTIHLSSIQGESGKGNSQKNSADEYQLDLSEKKWYVFNDNYGTTEEKYFIKYFNDRIESRLEEKGLEYYIIRNERFPDLAIYSFNDGERFEPDFLLFVKKRDISGNNIYQAYAEPKGNFLLENDRWKEEFLNQISDHSEIQGHFKDNYKILGLPFFNKENTIEKFEKTLNEWLDKI